MAEWVFIGEASLQEVLDELARAITAVIKRTSCDQGVKVGI